MPPCGRFTRITSSTPTCTWTTSCLDPGLQALSSSTSRLAQESLVYPLELGFGVPGKGGALLTLHMSNFVHRCALRLATSTASPSLFKIFPRSAVSLETSHEPQGTFARRLSTGSSAVRTPSHPGQSPYCLVAPGATPSQDCVVVINARLWGRQGDVVDTTAVCSKDYDRFGNRDGEFAPEADGEDDVGTWERSAISARFFLIGRLRTKGSTYRHIFEEVHPFRTYGNDDGYLRMESAVTPQPPPHPSIHGISIHGASGDFRCAATPSPGTSSMRPLPPRRLVEAFFSWPRMQKYPRGHFFAALPQPLVACKIGSVQ